VSIPLFKKAVHNLVIQMISFLVKVGWIEEHVLDLPPKLEGGEAEKK